MSQSLLSDSEREILQIVWDSGGEITITDLLGRAQALGHGWKRATVRTFIARLMEKGAIRSRREGRQCRYCAAVTREEYLGQQARLFVDDVFGGSVRRLMASLFGPEPLSGEELDSLEAHWEARKGELHE